jgi:hypothetical protein
MKLLVNARGWSVLDVNVNTVLSCQGAMDPVSGPVGTGAIPAARAA